MGQVTCENDLLKQPEHQNGPNQACMNLGLRFCTECRPRGMHAQNKLPMMSNQITLDTLIVLLIKLG